LKSEYITSLYLDVLRIIIIVYSVNASIIVLNIKYSHILSALEYYLYTFI